MVISFISKYFKIFKLSLKKEKNYSKNYILSSICVCNFLYICGIKKIKNQQSAYLTQKLSFLKFLDDVLRFLQPSRQHNSHKGLQK